MANQLPIEFLENDFLRLEYLTTTGPRIVGLYARGVDGNLLAETPDVHWPTPHGEFYLRGGHRLWTAPEDPFYTCPEDGLIATEKKNVATLKSPIDASGLEKEISFHLNGNRVSLNHRITWHGKDSIEFAPWAITQFRLGGMAILPLTQQVMGDNGLSPNRNLVFWPYAHIDDVRFELHDDVVLLHGQAGAEAFKVGNFNKHGWIACALGDALVVKRFSVDHFEKYADMGCNVEAYVKDVCVELETLGALKTLQPGNSMTHEETWEVTTGHFPATLETAQRVLRDLV
ncbi:MAG: hypothetical protein HYZ23_03565 [Chloroflexi bacterium]|nr:hypothetical protein [Chloroflexota bacterium]